MISYETPVSKLHEGDLLTTTPTNVYNTVMRETFFTCTCFMQWFSPYQCIAWSLDPVFNTWQPEPIIQFK